MTAIDLDGVRVVRGGKVALDVPRLTLRPGAITAVLGPNGSGKSTLLRAIAGLERPAEGRVLLAGQVVRRDRATHEQLAMSFQRPVFLAGTVRANLELGLRLRRIAPPERAHRILDAAASLGIAHLLGRPARRLSGGEGQRVNLARALALRAPVTLLDEPLAGLDEPSRESLIRQLPPILAALGTVVLVTHDRTEAARLADDVVILLGGRVHASGLVGQVFATPPDADTATFLGWTIVAQGGALRAIAPGALRLTGADVPPGDHVFEFDVDRVLQVGDQWEVLGRIGAASAVLAGVGPPPSGARAPVTAASCDVLCFPAVPNVNLPPP